MAKLGYPIGIDAGLAQVGAQVMGYLVGMELIVTGGDGRMGRKHRPGAHGLQGRFKRQVRALSQFAKALDQGKRAMALVQMQHRGVHPHRPQRAHPADAQQDFLPDSHVGVTLVQLGRELAILGCVTGNIGVQQQDRTASHVHPPEPCLHPPVGNRNADGQRRPIRRRQHGDRLAVKVRLGMQFLLTAGWIDGLPEVSLAVQHPHRHQRHAQVARGFHMIARQHAQTARIQRHRLGDPVFHREIRHRQVRRLREFGREPGTRLQVPPPTRHHLAQVVHEGGIGRASRQLVRRHLTQQRHRVVLRGLPRVGIDAPKDVLGTRIPGPPQVVRQFAQPLQLVRNCRTHRNDVVRLHVRHDDGPISLARRPRSAA